MDEMEKCYSFITESTLPGGLQMVHKDRNSLKLHSEIKELVYQQELWESKRRRMNGEEAVSRHSPVLNPCINVLSIIVSVSFHFNFTTNNAVSHSFYALTTSWMRLLSPPSSSLRSRSKSPDSNEERMWGWWESKSCRMCNMNAFFYSSRHSSSRTKLLSLS